jgi:hypothetical protein
MKTAKTDTHRTTPCNQKLKLPVLPKDVTELQIRSRKVKQIAQPTDKGIRSQSGGKLFKLPRSVPFEI